ncbi:MAG: hypothetical protein OXU36_13365 [Candidatus Poribacteria bacterium]|nr:hypothetical protein [Candidatus Poribacteria bacterium]
MSFIKVLQRPIIAFMEGDENGHHLTGRVDVVDVRVFQMVSFLEDSVLIDVFHTS